MEHGTNIKSKVLLSLMWKLMERGGVQVIQFIVSIVIARLLSPSDYGNVAIISIFIALATVFVQAGLGTALIQKKDADRLDASSVFYCSLFLAVVVYIMLYFLAPLIANFYKMERITLLLRVMTLTLFPGALNSIQNAVVAKEMKFKKQFYSSIGASVISGIIGIILAFKGFKEWALVGQQLSYQILVCIIMWFTVNWRPYFEFSFERSKTLIKYGFKILSAKIIDTLYQNLISLIIGKKFSGETLAFYNKGKQFPLIIIDNIDGSIQSVMLPVFSLSQDDLNEVKLMLRRTVSISTYLVFPAMVGLATIAEPLILLILGEKWIMSVPYLRIYCLISALYPMQTVVLQAINAIGKSDVYLNIMTLKRIIGVIMLTVAVVCFKSVMAIIISSVFVEIVSTILCMIPTKLFFNYSINEQFNDILPNFFAAIIMGFSLYWFTFLKFQLVLTIFIQTLAGILIYLVVSILTRNSNYKYMISTVKSFVA